MSDENNSAEEDAVHGALSKGDAESDIEESYDKLLENGDNSDDIVIDDDASDDIVVGEESSAHIAPENVFEQPSRPRGRRRRQKSIGPAPVVEVRNLWVRYGKMVAVKGINLEIPKGEVFGFIGPNGAGKSSTIKVLATLQRKFEGSARVNGIDVRLNPTAVREQMGYVPDFFGVYEDLTAREYLHFFAAAYRINRKKRSAIVNDVLELTDLTNKIDAQVDTLSRGMKQRLSLARVLLHDPELLLLDEPTSGLDPRARIEVRELLKALTEMGKTILISSHILHELAHLCTRIGIIEAGQMVAQGSLDEIYQKLSLLRVVHLQLADTTPEVIEQISQIHGVAEVEEQVDRIAIRLHEDQTSVEDLHEAIYKLGARIRMYQPEAMDMETAFMKLTQGKTA